MKLENFRLAHRGGVELEGLGHRWDLHNFADCVERSHDPEPATARVRWELIRPNAWGDPSNDAAGCELRFEGVTRWVLVPGSGEDGETLESLGTQPLHEDDRHEADVFDMWLAFEDGAELKIAARSCRIVAIPAED